MLLYLFEHNLLMAQHVLRYEMESIVCSANSQKQLILA